ncbi:hypothetical protein [Clostridium tunisiense]|uniref:hypothetical protein n=1 Tax=Clostridium tunisiense TaxID=219748 RepID=UPI0002F1293E|nr:hypothetical protein [Clostridium tunisiense]
MRNFKFVLTIIFILCFSLTAYGSKMKPTAEEVFLESFLAELYTFNNNDLQNLYFYKFMYPFDKFSLSLRNYMTEKKFEDFSNQNLYYDFITSSYYNGFNSSIYYINIKPLRKNITANSYAYEATVELLYPHKNKKEVYTVTGEISISKINDVYKITNLNKIIFPYAGFSNVVSKLV